LKERVRRVPIGRALTIYEVAKSVLFFACEDSAGVTATSLIVDGGMLGGAEWDTESVKDK
jgi:NAD(P)-dependent dehydrogenase (short-subunit alcohol dehydrogenase family)